MASSASCFSSSFGEPSGGVGLARENAAPVTFRGCAIRAGCVIGSCGSSRKRFSQWTPPGAAAAAAGSAAAAAAAAGKLRSRCFATVPIRRACHPMAHTGGIAAALVLRRPTPSLLRLAAQCGVAGAGRRRCHSLVFWGKAKPAPSGASTTKRSAPASDPSRRRGGGDGVVGGACLLADAYSFNF